MEGRRRNQCLKQSRWDRSINTAREDRVLDRIDECVDILRRWAEDLAVQNSETKPRETLTGESNNQEDKDDDEYGESIFAKDEEIMDSDDQSRLENDSYLCEVENVFVQKLDEFDNVSVSLPKVDTVGEEVSSCDEYKTCEDVIPVEIPNIEVIDFVIVEPSIPQGNVVSFLINSIDKQDQHSRSNVFEEWENDAGIWGLDLNVLGLQRVQKLKWNTKRPWRSKCGKIGFERRVWVSKVLF